MKSTRKTNLHQGTAGELTAWLEKLCNAIHPDNAVEYWSPGRSDYERDASPHLRRTDKLPTRIHHVAAYVRSGSCEGHVLEVALMERDDAIGTFRFLCWAKVFGSKEAAWELAKTVSAALEEIFMFEGQSIIPDLWEKLPKDKWSYVRNTNLWGAYQVIQDSLEDRKPSVAVLHESGKEIDRQEFTQKYQADAYADDWMSVLSKQENVKAKRLNAAPATV